MRQIRVTFIKFIPELLCYYYIYIHSKVNVIHYTGFLRVVRELGGTVSSKSMSSGGSSAQISIGG